MCNDQIFKKAAHLLCRLGITANYIGFYHTVYAIMLAVKEPERLQLVTKWLYPDVATAYSTNTDNVRKNIDRVCRLAWERNPELLSEFAYFDLKKKPGTSEFLAILVGYITN